jgi:hypothetical protein
MAGGDDRFPGGRMLPIVAAAIVGIVAAVLVGISLGGGTPTTAGLPSSNASISADPGSASAGLLSSQPSAGDSGTLIPTGPTTPTAAPTPKRTKRPTPAPTPTQPPRPTAPPTPTPTPNTNPAILTFKAPASVDCPTDNGQIHISWTIARATGAILSIDGPGAYATYPGTSQSIDVPFACGSGDVSHTYTLTTTGGTGPAATRTRTVTRRPSPTP